ncbi:MAG: protein kinase [Deltaproteobacteria bacterium]|nr:protein kinase [Deltaproteobacteria bacterium]
MQAIKQGALVGKYRIVKPHVAAGGNGVVHLAEETGTGRKCAIKVLNRELFLQNLRSTSPTIQSAKDEETAVQKMAGKFREEFKTVLGLNHPNVAQMLDLGFHEGHFYIVSEFVEGDNLFQNAVSKKPLEAIPLFIQVLEGLEFIHHHDLLHLDIKPENILVGTCNGKPCPKLIDFGASLSIQKLKAKPRGTIPCMAPEMALGQLEKIDARTDLFSFGVVMYQCLTSTLPFKGRKRCKTVEALPDIVRQETLPAPMTDYDAEIPEFLNTIVMRLLAKNPEDRVYSSARAVINALLTQLSDAFSSTPQAPAVYLAPARDKHIGRSNLQKKWKDALAKLLEGKKIEKPFFYIHGDPGMGKTHLLKTFYNEAIQKAESINVFYLASSPQDGWLKALEGTKPILILADDIHELPSDFLSTINLPILLFCTGEDALSVDFPSELTETEELQPFSLAELKEYLSSTPALSKRDIPEAWAKHLMLKTCGIPSEVAAHLQELDSGGLLFDTKGNILFAQIEEPDMETSLIFHGGTQPTQDRILRQCDDLPKIERDILHLLSVWNLLGLATAPSFEDFYHFFPSMNLALSLSNMAGKNILKYDPITKTHSFTNPVAQQTIYNSIEASERMALHDALGKYFLKRNDLTYSLHCGFGSDNQKAIYHLLKSARLQRLKGALITSQRLIQETLERAPKNELKLRAYILLLYISVCHARGKYGEAEQRFKESLTILEQYGQKARLLKLNSMLQIILVRLESNHTTEAYQLIQEGIALNQATPVLLYEIYLKNYEAFYHYLKAFDGQDAITHLEKAEALYLESSKLEGRLHPSLSDRISNNYLERVLKARGNYKEAIHELESKLPKYEKQGKIFDLVAAYLMLAECHRHLKNYGEAEKVAKEMLRLAKKTGQGKWLMEAHMALANIYHDSDRFELALEEDKSSLVASAFLDSETERKKMWSWLTLRQGLYLKELKRWDEALGHFERALAAKVSGWHLAETHEGLAEVYFNKKDFEKALFHLQETESVLKNLTSDAVRFYQFRIAMIRALIHKQKGLADKAKEALPLLKKLAAKDPQLVQECASLESQLNG